jgi:hypothetical protein
MYQTVKYHFKTGGNTMSNIFKEWNSKVDTEELKKDVEEASKNSSNFEDVPHGNYEVEVTKMELKPSKAGDPMLAIQFKIVSNDCKGRIIFYNKLLTKGFWIHEANEMLRSLDVVEDVRFENFVQYNTLVEEIYAGTEVLEYALEYSKNSKGYDTHKITEVFED